MEEDDKFLQLILVCYDTGSRMILPEVIKPTAPFYWAVQWNSHPEHHIQRLAA